MRLLITLYSWISVCVRARVRACVRAHACVRACNVYTRGLRERLQTLVYTLDSEIILTPRSAFPFSTISGKLLGERGRLWMVTAKLVTFPSLGSMALQHMHFHYLVIAQTKTTFPSKEVITCCLLAVLYGTITRLTIVIELSPPTK